LVPAVIIIFAGRFYVNDGGPEFINAATLFAIEDDIEGLNIFIVKG
jgi:hypothetical protein